MIETRWEIRYPKYNLGGAGDPNQIIGHVPYDGAPEWSGVDPYSINLSQMIDNLWEKSDSLYIWITISLPIPDLRGENFVQQ